MELRTTRTVVAVLAASLLVVLALASTALASSTRYLVPSAYPATLVGENHNSMYLKTNIPIHCQSSSFSTKLNSPTDEVGIAPSFPFSSCEAQMLQSWVTVTVSMNSCKFILQPNGTVDIGPAGCGPIKIFGQACEQLIPAQSNVGSAQRYAVSGGKVAVDLELSGLQYTSSGWACGPSGSYSNGFLSGTWNIGAKGPAGEALGIQVSERLPDGVYLTGTAGQSGNLPRLEAERFPVLLDGESGASTYVVKTKAGTLKCSAASFAGSAASSTDTIAGTPSFAGCKLATVYGDIGMTASVNGCSYEYSVAGSGPYSGQMTLNCPSGKSLELKGGGCSVTLPAQTLGSVAYGATGSGPYRAVTTSVSGSTIKSSSTGFLCNATGAAEGGTFSESGVIRGSTE
jgi:hypothetical protein